MRIGGRPRQIETADIVRAGRELGLRDLSMNAVAARLGVSSTALYRHVDGRWELERLVGESILAGLDFHDDPAHGPVRHLLSFALELRGFILRHPGLAAYVQTLFPRGEGGRRLLAVEAEALVRRGYSMDAAIVLSSAVALIAVGYAATEEVQRERAEGLGEQRRGAEEGILTDSRLADAHRKLPDIGAEEYVRLWLGAAIRGFVEAAPPGRPVDEIRSALRATGEGE
ncbi:TetR/AcrR family transcriptional regulator [Nonomuraea rubra]|uniref:AcrR family transcriptional regulator n=2 Tax=Nonomuraea rubra TaxID=46180 RepID=A0A7X0U198_9ACTN|nr:TetR/AcrR family transcriptional regulator [Nonomuraea rubra]MBB6551368.1 AcrR family transcriptional regulator [Nonomuraea rubra]